MASFVRLEVVDDQTCTVVFLIKDTTRSYRVPKVGTLDDIVAEGLRLAIVEADDTAADVRVTKLQTAAAAAV